MTDFAGARQERFGDRKGPDVLVNHESPSPIASLRVGSVLFRNSPADVWKLARSMSSAAPHLLESQLISRLSFVIGDCSEPRCLAPADIAAITGLVTSAGIDFEYRYFGENLGPSEGSNRLIADHPSDLVFFLNPQTFLAPTALAELVGVFADPTIGACDGRRIPFEHPKFYDPVTGDQSWASGACLMARHNVFAAAGGFDAASFFSYCNDVDLSWRIRLLGHRVMHVPSAVVFHDKRLGRNAGVAPTATEAYGGLLGRMILAGKYARPDVLDETIRSVEEHGDDHQRRALVEYERRRRAHELPIPITGAGDVAEFNRGEYAVHGF